MEYYKLECPKCKRRFPSTIPDGFIGTHDCKPPCPSCSTKDAELIALRARIEDTDALSAILYLKTGRRSTECLQEMQKFLKGEG